MAQWLRVLTALPEVLSSIPSNHMLVRNHLVYGQMFSSCVSEDSDSVFTHIKQVNKSFEKKEGRQTDRLLYHDALAKYMKPSNYELRTLGNHEPKQVFPLGDFGHSNQKAN